MVVVWKYSMTIMGPKTDMKGVKVSNTTMMRKVVKALVITRILISRAPVYQRVAAENGI